jgi:hypothetical protein
MATTKPEAPLAAALHEVVDALALVVGALKYASRTDLARGEVASELERAELRVARARNRLAEAA